MKTTRCRHWQFLDVAHWQTLFAYDITAVIACGVVSYGILLGSRFTTMVMPAWGLLSALPEITAWRYVQLQDESSSAETSGSDDGSSEDESVAEGLASNAVVKSDLFVTGKLETTA